MCPYETHKLAKTGGILFNHPPPPGPRIDGNDGTQGLALHIAILEVRGKGAERHGEHLILFRPPLKNGGMCKSVNTSFHSFTMFKGGCANQSRVEHSCEKPLRRGVQACLRDPKKFAF